VLSALYLKRVFTDTRIPECFKNLTGQNACVKQN